MEVGQVVCYVHGTPFPRASCHEHHEMPQAAGGSDDPANLTFVCANCHNMIHRIADLLRANRKGFGADIALQYSPNDLSMRDRLLRLAEYAAASMQSVDDGETPGATDQVIQVVLPRAIYERFKILVGDHRANGRKVSIQSYMQNMVLKELAAANMLTGIKKK